MFANKVIMDIIVIALNEKLMVVKWCCWCVDDESSVDSTVVDAGGEKTSKTKSSTDEVTSVAESQQNCEVVKCTDADVDGESESAASQMHTALTSLTPSASQRLDGALDDSTSDIDTDDKSLTEGRRRPGIRTATSPLSQVSPKRRKLQRPADGTGDNDTSEENRESACVAQTSS